MKSTKMKKTYRGTLRVDIVKKMIFVSATFRRACADIDSDEYELLLRVQQEHPDFRVEERTIKKNPSKESYRGLTYEYMEQYIASHDGDNSQAMEEYKELRQIARCHSISFPKIRDWFFETYPDVKNFTVEQLREKNADGMLEHNEQRLAA